MNNHLRPIAVGKAQEALNRGAKIEPLPLPFFSGGHIYTHALTTKSGAQYRVSQWVFRRLSSCGI